MKTITLLVMVVMISTSASAQTSNFHDFTVQSIDGGDFPLSQLKGKKVLIVNVASKCGFTPQYEKLQALYETYGGDQFTIIGFPANNFKKQEPGTNEEIVEFCRANYGVTFPMMAKISVKGEHMAPVYEWLTKKNQNGKEDADVSWNFQKFLVDENGNWVGTFSPKTDPMDEKIISWIEGK